MPWNPDVYNRFKNERYTPFYDLLAMIKPAENMQVIDLGCGTGELTAKLADAMPHSQVLGIDSSPQMLQKAEAFRRLGLNFRQETIENVIKEDSQWDLVFSHAAIQWIDDHERLLPQLIRLVRPGGQIAIQMPSNHHHFTHTAIKAIAGMEPYKSALQGWTRTAPVLDIQAYAQILYEHGGKEINIYEKVYPHVLPDADTLADWTSGTALLPYMERLPEMQASFMDAYRAKLQEKWPQGPVFYPFKRILMRAAF